MIIVHPEGQAGTAGKPGSQFTGDAFPYVTMPATDGVVINTVVFTPGARTHWHTHERGQILQVLGGRGRIQSQGGPVEVLRMGDTVWIPAGETHWHGAASDSFMTHTAISLGTTVWAQPVTDEEYDQTTHVEGTDHDKQ
jgi:quercetin dioxygenase-like cupin family protein